MSAALSVPAPVVTKLTVAVPLVVPDVAVLASPTDRLVASVPPATRGVVLIAPLLVKPVGAVPKLAFRDSVYWSGEVLVTLTLADGAASPTRAASVTLVVLSVGLARR